MSWGCFLHDINEGKVSSPLTLYFQLLGRKGRSFLTFTLAWVSQTGVPDPDIGGSRGRRVLGVVQQSITIVLNTWFIFQVFTPIVCLFRIHWVRFPTSLVVTSSMLVSTNSSVIPRTESRSLGYRLHTTFRVTPVELLPDPRVRTVDIPPLTFYEQSRFFSF